MWDALGGVSRWESSIAERLPCFELKSARLVRGRVRPFVTESLEFEAVGFPSDADRFRKADPAKGAIKEYIKAGPPSR